MKITATADSLRQNPRNNPRTEAVLIHVLRRYRPAGAYHLSDPTFTPAPSPCLYPKKVAMPGLKPYGYAIEIGRGATGPCPKLTTTGDCTRSINHGGPHSDGKWTDLGLAPRYRRRRGADMGRPADPRYYSTDDFYPVMERAAIALAKLWRAERSAAIVARRTGVPLETVEAARAEGAEAAPTVIKHFRGIQTSRETLNKQRQVFKLMHPDLVTVPARRAQIDAAIDAFLGICPATV